MWRVLSVSCSMTRQSGRRWWSRQRGGWWRRLRCRSILTFRGGGGGGGGGREGRAGAVVMGVLAMAGQAGCGEARLGTWPDRLAAIPLYVQWGFEPLVRG